MQRMEHDSSPLFSDQPFTPSSHKGRRNEDFVDKIYRVLDQLDSGRVKDLIRRATLGIMQEKVSVCFTMLPRYIGMASAGILPIPSSPRGR